MADDDATPPDDTNEDEDFGALTGGSDEAEDSDSFGMGSLPPLSDFDSGTGDSDSDLPPLDTPDSTGNDGGTSPISGLPPIVDIKVDTPAVRPADLDTPTSKGDEEPETPVPAGLETPTPTSDLDSPDIGGLGFQDFAADSDFSPETPEIGPGPDSDIETPMFDSAFGGDSDDFSTGNTSTPAPTQAMETPLFGSQPDSDSAGPAASGGMGFDDDAFGIPTPDVGGDSGTPVPDFSPDTGAGVAPDVSGLAAMPGKAPKKTSIVVSILKYAVIIIVFFAVGVLVKPYLPFLSDPSEAELERQSTEITGLKSQIQRITRASADTPGGISAEEVEQLIETLEDTKTKLRQEETRLTATEEQLNVLNNSVDVVLRDLEDKNGQFVDAQEALEGLNNQNAITRARHEGLLAENERLTEMVGELEVANARRQSTKDTLLHNIDLLTVNIDGGSPLAPRRFDHAARLGRVRALHDKVARAKWVDPQLLDEYTNLYLAELGISNSREYFFARIPVHDKLGNVRNQWAECLMNGNWSVYFRTIDGAHVGSYENAAGSGPPQYEFREDLPGGMKADIFDAIKASRVENYQDKIAVLEQKQRIYDSKTRAQTSFSSL